MNEFASSGQHEPRHRSTFSGTEFDRLYKEDGVTTLPSGMTVDVEVFPVNHIPGNSAQYVPGVTLTEDVDVSTVAFKSSGGKLVTGSFHLDSSEGKALEREAYTTGREEGETAMGLRNIIEGELREDFLRNRPDLIEKIGIEPGEIDQLIFYVDLDSGVEK